MDRDFQRETLRSEYFSRKLWRGEQQGYGLSRGWKLLMKRMPKAMTINELEEMCSTLEDTGRKTHRVKLMSIDLWDEKNSKTAVVEYAHEKDVMDAINMFDGRWLEDHDGFLICSIVD